MLLANGSELKTVEALSESESERGDYGAFRLSHSLICAVISLLGSGPKGADDLCFHTGEISPFLSTLIFYLYFEAQILVLRPKF